MPYSLRAFALVFVLATPAWAAPYDLQVNLEPGVASWRPPGAEERHVGYLGGATLSLGVTSLLALELGFDRQEFRIPPKRVDVWEGSLVYTIDVLYVTPFVTLGLAYVRLAEAEVASEIAPQLGLGFDVGILRHFSAGLVVRYLPLAETALLDAPAYVTLHARLGIKIDSYSPSP